MNKKVYQALASAIGARIRCKKNGNDEWFPKWEDRINEIIANYLPQGSGIDSGNTINMEKSHSNKIVIESGYHCMDEYGGYDGWIDFSIIITPDLVTGFGAKITGRFSDRHNKYSPVREYLYDIYISALNDDIED